MARDYAARNKRPAPKPAGLPGWVWLIAGLSMGLVVACIVYIGRPAQPMPMSDADRARRATADKPKPRIEIPPKEDPRFDFYTLLESEQVVPSDGGRPRTPAPPQPTRPATPPANPVTPPPEGTPPVPRTPAQTAAAAGSQYIVLAGSFREAANAEAHKAKLALAGVEARIQTITTQDQVTLHRVRIGPANSLEQAQGVAAKLKNQGFDSQVVKFQ